MADLSIRVTGKLQEWNFGDSLFSNGLKLYSVSVNEYSALFQRGEIRATGVDDMVNQILNRLGSQDRIGTLKILDHGAPWWQRLGDDLLSSVSINTEHNASLKRLTGRFAPDATVILGGCNVGRWRDVSEALSVVWRVRVLAGTTYQWPLIPGIEGRVRECFDGECRIVGESSFLEWLQGVIPKGG